MSQAQLAALSSIPASVTAVSLEITASVLGVESLLTNNSRTPAATHESVSHS